MSARPEDTRRNLARERELHEQITPELRARILRLVRRIVWNDALAEDAAQDALLALWRKPHALEPEHDRLLKTIVRRCALKVLRAERRHAHEELTDDVSDEA